METATSNEKKLVDQLWEKRPLIISGPCSAESEEQVVETAIRLKNTGQVDMLRAGIWKPRTRPGSFEGVGTIGLPWLQKAKAATGLPTAVEVAMPKQVEDSLAFGVDLLWIGARTTVNPFSVQDVADALRGADVPVLIKNPINPDIELWVGAVERIAKAGIKKIGLIHRGFSSYGNTEYRNAPMWHLAVEMRRRFPDMLFINDPSHISGRRDLLHSVAQHAANMKFDGLILESHIDPDNAWSDAKQQITPEKAGELFESLVWPQQGDVRNDEELEKYRQQINHLDDELFQVLSQRMKIADKIGIYKRDHDMAALQASRWNEIIEKYQSKAEKLGLSKAFIASYLEAVHIESINHQNAVMSAEK